MTRKKPSQIDRFREKARELGCDESEDAFNTALGKIVPPRTPPKTDPPKPDK